MSKTSKTKTPLTEEQLAKVAGGMRPRGWHASSSSTSRVERRSGGNRGSSPSYKAVQ